MKTAAGNVLGGAAEHLLGENGGIKPAIPLRGLDSALESWVMFPRTKPELKVQVISSAMRARISPNNDWLVFKISSPPSGITPLRPRKEPVAVGETVFLIGVSYDDPNVSQRVYTGKVTSRLDGTDRFRYDISPPVNLRGFSGAPIVDSQGFLVGVMTVWFDPKMSGENYLEGGGEDVASALESIFPSL